jgi:hypothetical protein
VVPKGRGRPALRSRNPLSPDVRSIHNDLLLLNRYYIETRYPGDYPAFSMDEAHAAFDAALRVKDFVREKADFKA